MSKKEILEILENRKNFFVKRYRDLIDEILKSKKIDIISYGCYFKIGSKNDFIIFDPLFCKGIIHTSIDDNVLLDF